MGAGNMRNKSQVTANAVENVLQEMIQEEEKNGPVNISDYCRKYPDLAPFLYERYELACLAGELPATLQKAKASWSVEKHEEYWGNLSERLANTEDRSVRLSTVNGTNNRNSSPNGRPSLPSKASKKFTKPTGQIAEHLIQSAELIEQMIINFCHRNSAMKGAAAIRSYTADQYGSATTSIALTAILADKEEIVLDLKRCEKQSDTAMQLNFTWPADVYERHNGQQAAVQIKCGSLIQRLGNVTINNLSESTLWTFEG